MKHSLYMTNSNYHMVNLVSLIDYHMVNLVSLIDYHMVNLVSMIDNLYPYIHIVIEIDSYVLRNGCK